MHFANSKMENNKSILLRQPLVFSLQLLDEDDRIDCAWHNPITEQKLQQLRGAKNSKRKMYYVSGTKKKIADVNGGKRLPKGTILEDSEENTIPYVRVGDVHDLEVRPHEAAKISKSIHHEIQNYQIKKNDIVITIVGATIGKVGILKQEVEVCDFTENLARIRIRDEFVEPLFLLHYLDSDIGRMQSDRFSVGALQFKLSLGSCRSIEVFMPYDPSKEKIDRSEQVRIMNGVYALLDKATEHMIKRRAIIEEMKSIPEEEIGIEMPREEVGKMECFFADIDGVSGNRIDALYNNPFREKLVNKLKRQPHSLLGNLVEPDKKQAIKPESFYRLVELEDIDADTGRVLAPREVPELGSDKIILNSGSLVVSKLQPENGKVAIIDESIDGCVGSSELIPVVLKSSEVTLEYLWAILRSRYVLGQWKHELTGASRMRINPKELDCTVVPIPERKVQDKIVQRLFDSIKKCDEQLAQAKQLTEKSRDLFSNLVFVK